MYNGWSNYETWAVKHHMSDRWRADYWRSRAEYNPAGLAEELKQAYEAALPKLDGFSLTGFDNVNWTEIAESLLADLRAEVSNA